MFAESDPKPAKSQEVEFFAAARAEGCSCNNQLTPMSCEAE